MSNSMFHKWRHKLKWFCFESKFAIMEDNQIQNKTCLSLLSA